MLARQYGTPVGDWSAQFQVVRVDTFASLGLSSSFPFPFSFGISGSAKLLEHDPFVDLTGPEKLVLFHLFQRSLECGPIGHQLVHLSPSSHTIHPDRSYPDQTVGTEGKPAYT